MFDLANDIQSLSHFKRNSAELMKRMKEPGNPVVLTVNGKAEVVVQDAQAYQRLMELAARAEMMEFLEASRKDIDEGRTVPAREALEELERRRQAPSRDQ
ncbi:MAG: type II toxin-antitoxin system Phd/YefM family antitoxin [Gemmataceae bacterium]